MILISSISILNLILLFLWNFAAALGLPSGLITILSAGAVAKNLSEVFILILLFFVAAVLGDIVAYSIARKFSSQITENLRKFSFFRDSEEKARKLLGRYGFWIVFFTRFALLSLCAVVSYVSGLEKLSKKKFILAVVLGEILYACGYTLLGYYVGIALGDLINSVNYIIAAIILLLILIYLIVKFAPRIFRKRI